MRDNPATDLLGAAFALCAVLNLIAAVTSLEGWLWLTVRAMASVTFLLAAIWWLTAAARHFFTDR